LTVKAISSTDAQITAKSTINTHVTSKSKNVASHSVGNSTKTISGTGSTHCWVPTTISVTGSHPTSSSPHYSMTNYTGIVSGSVGTVSGTASTHTWVPTTISVTGPHGASVAVSGTGYYTSKETTKTDAETGSSSASSKTETGIAVGTLSSTLSSQLSMVTETIKS
jgi:hypothetical protein